MTFEDFKRTDLAFFIERFQILLDVINTDLAGNLEGSDDAVYWAQVLWDNCKNENEQAARMNIEWFMGYLHVIPQSHRNSYKQYLLAVNKMVGGWS